MEIGPNMGFPNAEAVILLNITSTGRIIALGNYIRKLGIIA